MIFGAFGGRFDQEMQNMNALYQWSGRFGQLTLLSEECYAALLPAGESCLATLPPLEGRTCGLIPLGCPVRSLTTRGLHWDVSDWSTSFGASISSSNRLSCYKRSAAGIVVDESALRRVAYDVAAAAAAAAAGGCAAEAAASTPVSAASAAAVSSPSTLTLSSPCPASLSASAAVDDGCDVFDVANCGLRTAHHVVTVIASDPIIWTSSIEPEMMLRALAAAPTTPSASAAPHDGSGDGTGAAAVAAVALPGAL